MGLLLALALGGDAERAIRAWTKEPLVYVDARDVRDVPGLVVARCDTQEDWWGFFGCYGMKDGAVEWRAAVDEEPTEQSIFSVRGWKSDIVGAPLIAVIGRTHMGNGFLYVYELRDRALRLVLRTRAFDSNPQGGEVFRGGALGVDIQRDRVTLTGVIQEFPDEKDDRAARERPCAKTFVWDPKLRRFSHDAARRFGFTEPETWPPE